MPRRSKASLTIASITPIRRLEPPPELGPIDAEVFRSTVASVAPSHFQAEDVPLLASYARTVVLLRQASAELAREPVVGTAPSPWLRVHSGLIRSLAILTTRLRLGPRARDHHPRTAKPASQPSFYATMTEPPT